MIELAQGLDAFHANRIHYRCLNAENILLRIEAGTVEEIRVQKPGYSSFLPLLERLGGQDFLECYAYLAPELKSGKSSDKRADIYSLGIHLYRFLTGRLPFNQKSERLAAGSVSLNHVAKSLARRGVPEVISRIVLSSLRKNPEKRFASCFEFIADLRTYLDERRMETLRSGGADPTAELATLNKSSEKIGATEIIKSLDTADYFRAISEAITSAPPKKPIAMVPYVEFSDLGALEKAECAEADSGDEDTEESIDSYLERAKREVAGETWGNAIQSLSEKTKPAVSPPLSYSAAITSKKASAIVNPLASPNSSPEQAPKDPLKPITPFSEPSSAKSEPKTDIKINGSGNTLQKATESTRYLSDTTRKPVNVSESTSEIREVKERSDIAKAKLAAEQTRAAAEAQAAAEAKKNAETEAAAKAKEAIEARHVEEMRAVEKAEMDRALAAQVVASSHMEAISADPAPGRPKKNRPSKKVAASGIEWRHEVVSALQVAGEMEAVFRRSFRGRGAFRFIREPKPGPGAATLSRTISRFGEEGIVVDIGPLSPAADTTDFLRLFRAKLTAVLSEEIETSRRLLARRVSKVDPEGAFAASPLGLLLYGDDREEPDPEVVESQKGVEDLAKAVAAFGRRSRPLVLIIRCGEAAGRSTHGLLMELARISPAKPLCGFVFFTEISTEKWHVLSKLDKSRK